MSPLGIKKFVAASLSRSHTATQWPTLTNRIMDGSRVFALILELNHYHKNAKVDVNIHFYPRSPVCLFDDNQDLSRGR